MVTTETGPARQTDNKFMHLLRVAANRQLSKAEIQTAKLGGELPEKIIDISDGDQKSARAYFTAKDGYAAVSQKFEFMTIPDPMQSRRIEYYGFYMVRQDVRRYTSEGKLVSRSTIKNSGGLDVSPVGSGYEIEVVYDPPGRLWGKRRFKRRI